MNCEIDLKDIIGWLLTVTGFGVGIWQFIVQMKKDREKLASELRNNRENRERENKTTWFLNVIVLPHLPSIHKFYNKISEVLIDQKRGLKDCVKDSHENFIEKRAQAQNVVKKEICKFYDFLNPLVSSYSNQLGAKLIEVKNNLEDLCTSFLEDESGNENITLIELMNNKQYLLKILNAEMSIDH